MEVEAEAEAGEYVHLPFEVSWAHIVALRPATAKLRRLLTNLYYNSAIPWYFDFLDTGARS